MKNEPLVSINIIGWNNYDDVINCFKSLSKIDYSNFNIILVDNGSRESNYNKFISWLDKTGAEYEILKKNAKIKKQNSTSGKVYLKKNSHNLGFTGGSNIALAVTFKVCNPKYLLLLNGDTLVTKDFLTNLVKECEKDEKIGSAQSVLLRFDKKTIDSLGIVMIGHKAYDNKSGEDKSVLSDFNDCSEIFGSCGASALYRADLLKKIGLFDESLFATYEDFDLSWRIRMSGYKIVLVKNSIVYHRGGVSRVRGDHKIFDMRSYYGAKNALVTYNRYYPITVAVISTCLFRFVIASISALKNQRVKEFASIVYNFPKQRRKVSKNRRLKEIQRQWIK